MKHVFTFLCLMLTTLMLRAQATLDQPEAKAATNITANAFTANWGAVKKAEAYCAFVYKQTKVAKTGETVIMDEEFSGITQGSLVEPAGGEETYVDLSELGYSENYGWSVYAFPYYVKGMVDGRLYSPYLDLRGNNGKFKVVITSYCTDGDELRVESHGAGGTIIKYVNTHVDSGKVGLSTDTVEFDNGCKDLFLAMINNTAEVAQADFFDRVQILQDLNEGDIINTMVASNETIEAENDWGEEITSCRFGNMPYAAGEKILYYDVYAVMYDWSTPNGHLPYTAVYSDFSDLVKVDMTSRTSEIVTGIQNIETGRTKQNDACFNLAGQRIKQPHHGIYIKNGKKLLTNKNK